MLKTILPVLSLSLLLTGCSTGPVTITRNDTSNFMAVEEISFFDGIEFTQAASYNKNNWWLARDKDWFSSIGRNKKADPATFYITGIDDTTILLTRSKYERKISSVDSVVFFSNHCFVRHVEYKDSTYGRVQLASKYQAFFLDKDKLLGVTTNYPSRSIPAQMTISYLLLNGVTKGSGWQYMLDNTAVIKTFTDRQKEKIGFWKEHIAM